MICAHALLYDVHLDMKLIFVYHQNETLEYVKTDKCFFKIEYRNNKIMRMYNWRMPAKYHEIFNKELFRKCRLLNLTGSCHF
jgi:hypothetical protein